MHSQAGTRAIAWANLDEATVLRTLNTFAVDLISIPGAEDLFWYVTQNVVGRMNFLDCVVYEASADKAELRQVAAWGDKNPFGRNIVNPLVIPFGQGITGQVAATGKAILVGDLLKEQNYIPDTQIARSEVCVPLLVHGQVVGVIDSEHPMPNAFGEAELEILTTVAAMTGAKLELLAEAGRSTRRYHDLVASHAQLTQEITARKALEAKLFEARRLEAIGRLTGRFAHEFNNLLTVILGNLEFLDISTEAIESAAFLQDAKASAGRGARMMRDMLAFAQRARLDPVVLDLKRLIEGFCAAQQSNLTSRVELDLSANLWPVRADPKAIETILSNLIENASDAVLGGGNVLIHSENMHYVLSSELLSGSDLPPGRYVHICVADTGVGIAPGKLSQIFDPFYTTKPVGSGTGLGLSTVRGLARQSGGAVAVTSELGRGTRFHVYLPAFDVDINQSLTRSE